VTAKNTGKEYERLTMQIFKGILAQDEVKNLQIEHDVQLQGLINEHQIDVNWRFQVGGIEHRVLVQAKDWTSKVKQEQMQAFVQILNDIPGQPRGVFVTRTGYQLGALQLGKAKGVELYTLREPTEADWKGLIRNLHVQVNAVIPWHSSPETIYDADWVNEQLTQVGVASGEPVPVSVTGFENKVWLYDEVDDPIETVADVTQSLFPTHEGEVAPTQVTRVFSEPTYLHSDADLRLPRVKIKSLSFQIQGTIHQSQATLKGDDAVRYMLKNITDGTQRNVDKNLQVRQLPALPHNW